MAWLHWCLILLSFSNVTDAKFTGPNMNGKYTLAQTPGQKEPPKWSTNFEDYPGGVDYFEVYAGPVKSTYGEVFWTALPEVNLPPDLVERFQGKGMAVVGFEADQVRRTPEGDVSVPINVAYNHHYGATLLGKGSSMERIRRDPNDPRQGGHPGCGALDSDPNYVNVPVEHTPAATGLPTSMVFGYANGGEYRKSYHGLAPPFAQIVDSPTRVSIGPMQIDTWNRDKMNITGGAFVPGPVPKSSQAPVTGPDAKYSGLLECPRTTRIRKHTTAGWNDSFAVRIFECHHPQRCDHAPGTADECFAAAQQLPGLAGVPLSKGQGLSSTLPAGCTVSRHGAAAKAYYNTNNASSVCCGSGVDTISGEQKSLVTLGLSLSVAHGVNITMTGPDGVWFGVGFDASSMANSPYAIVVDGKGRVSEHMMGEHAAGVELNASVQILSNSVAAGQRTVVMKRPLKGITPQHHNFDARKMTFDFIDAIGSGPDFAYHKTKTASSIFLWPVSAPTCLCSIPAVPFGQGGGTIEYIPTGESIGFTTSCNPTESILTNRNPTCDLRTYNGGLQTCHHGWHLLDADQEVPWQDQPLEYWMKFRLYYQEYDASLHKSAIYGPGYTQWGIGANTAEYDVPQCPHGTPTDKCIHEITGTVTPPGTDLHIAAAHYHCHAPTCLYIEVWNNKTGELLCREDTHFGQGANLHPDGDRFDEVGYIAQPPCLWGSPPLEPPPLVSGIPLFIKAVTNNTYGHTGEMALPQMLLASLPPSFLI